MQVLFPESYDAPHYQWQGYETPTHLQAAQQPSPEDDLTTYYEAKLTRAEKASTSGTVEIPAQFIQFVVIALIVTIVCLAVSNFVSNEQVKHCKSLYGGKFAVPIEGEVLKNEIKNYLYGG